MPSAVRLRERLIKRETGALVTARPERIWRHSGHRLEDAVDRAWVGAGSDRVPGDGMAGGVPGRGDGQGLAGVRESRAREANRPNASSGPGHADKNIVACTKAGS